MVLVQHEPIDGQALIRSVRTDRDGAVALFLGTVRDHTEGRSVTGLRYSAYEEMALQELKRVRDQALEQFEITRAAVVHRLGALEIGATSVAVAVAAPHRAAAFDACRFMIDTLKHTVPIWKKETFEDGEAWIEGED
ncbi:MAG: molybdenum cofactor biosynthesis protein MoaE [Acidobacteria bacterium]|nr:MAG: molybdenum cofactor biosynthesis protein MoaE [Acidobacteriota bacterium]